MIVTLSPAKLLDFDSPISTTKETKPLFQEEADQLYQLLEGSSVEDIKNLMNINVQLAHDVYQYVHAFQLSRTPQRQAIFAFNGMAYLGLQAKTFTEDDLVYAQDHLIHISGLYGALRPLDMIKPHRLEMHTSLVNSKGKNLYDFWGDTLSTYIADRMKEDDNIWVNLASKEYAKAVDRKLLPKGHTIITPVFKQQTDKGYKQIVVYAKKARGMMTRFILQNKITDLEHLKAFDEEGYYFSAQLSNDKEWVFIR